MKVISRNSSQVITQIGIRSDGSDRVNVISTVWSVEVVDDAGIDRILSFNHNPTDDELIAGVTLPVSVAPTLTKISMFSRIKDLHDIWLMWKDLRVEAQARALAATVITALQNQENLAWTDVTNAITTWRAAT